MSFIVSAILCAAPDELLIASDNEAKSSGDELTRDRKPDNAFLPAIIVAY